MIHSKAAPANFNNNKGDLRGKVFKVYKLSCRIDDKVPYIYTGHVALEYISILGNHVKFTTDKVIERKGRMSNKVTSTVHNFLLSLVRPTWDYESLGFFR